jgi:hypothetical protein
MAADVAGRGAQRRAAAALSAPRTASHARSSASQSSPSCTAIAHAFRHTPFTRFAACISRAGSPPVACSSACASWPASCARARAAAVVGERAAGAAHGVWVRDGPPVGDRDALEDEGHAAPLEHRAHAVRPAERVRDALEPFHPPLRARAVSAGRVPTCTHPPTRNIALPARTST